MQQPTTIEHQCIGTNDDKTVNPNPNRSYQPISSYPSDSLSSAHNLLPYALTHYKDFELECESSALGRYPVRIQSYYYTPSRLKLRLKVTAATLMSSLVTQAKERWKLQGDTGCYMLRNSRTKAVVDLSQPFRLTGLQQQCTLEMMARDSSSHHDVKIESSSIRVGLKYSGKLQEGRFSPDTTLFTVVKTIMPELLEIQESPPNFLKFVHVTYPINDLENITLRNNQSRSIGVSSGPVCFIVVGQEGQWKIDSVGGNQSADPDAFNPTDSMLNNHVVRSMKDEVQVPADTGLDGCKAALYVMKKRNFDEDSRKCILTLIKYVDNIVYRPQDTSTRSISTMNKAFTSRVSSVRGGVEFLLAVGFEEQEVADTNPIGTFNSGIIARDAQASSMLVLSPNRENTNLLLTARRLLASEALEIGVKRSDLPRPPQQIPNCEARTSSTVHQQAFDPYKSLVTTTLDTQPSADERGESITETQLKNLKALKNTIQNIRINRNITVLLPSVGNATESNFGIVEDLEDTKCDAEIIAKRVARQQADRKRLDKTPFQTKAMREVQHLRNTQVYSTTIIRVQFPNRIQLQASFRSTELVSAILEVVHESLSESFQSTPFHLYVTPPKRKLSTSAALTDEGLVPAAVVYINWDDKPGPSGDFLRPDLLRKGKELRTRDESYPQGIKLDPPARMVGESGPTVKRTAPTSQRKPPQSSSGKKPGWLKI